LALVCCIERLNGKGLEGSRVIGKQLAQYEVIERIGVGGMGEVFRARDVKLGREVALKVLPAEFAAHPERLARFQREAQVLAGFNHPNIATLYGFEQAEGVHFLAMELVDGVDLAERLQDGPIPSNEALRIAADIAEAMEAAHAQGIVHRDLKPANVKLTADDRVKVLDFGLAKAIAGDTPSGQDTLHSPTITSMGTVAGVILGTAAYMSPEQARGKAVDKLSDIWAFGCVLYEMLSGRRAFGGDSVSDTLVSLLERDPDWSALPADTPPAIHQLLRRCLQKDKRQRLQDIGDARIELRECLSGTSMSWSGTSFAPAAPARPARPSRSRWNWAVVGTAAGIALGFAVATFTRTSVEPPVMRVSITAPPDNPFEPMGDFAGPAAISPDGSMLVFTARDSTNKLYLWQRPLDATESRRIEGTVAATFPFWSPDGRSVGFFADGKLKRVEVEGGSPISLCDAPNGRGGAWNAEDVILFSPAFQSALLRVPASGGVPVAVTSLDTTQHTTHRWPRFLPDGEHFLFVAAHHDQSRTARNGVYYASLQGGEPKLLLQATTEALYAMERLLYVHDNTLMSVGFDPQSGSVQGNPEPLIDKVSFDPSTWKAAFSASQNGILAYHGSGGGNPHGSLSIFDRDGQSQTQLAPGSRHLEVALSRDGRKLLASVGATTDTDIWMYDIERELRTRLTFREGPDVTPVWSADGTRIAYSWLAPLHGNSALVVMNVDGGDQRVLLEIPDTQAWVTDWSPDGRFLLFTQGEYVGNQSGIWLLPLDGGEPQILVQSEFYNDRARFSPDGRWIAYRSNESGQPHVYATRFNPPRDDGTPASVSGKWQVSSVPGASIDWRNDGREIYYLTRDGNWMRAEINGEGDTFRVGRVSRLFNLTPWYLGRIVCSVSPNGQVFAATTHIQDDSPPVTLVLNWTNALQE
jgi:serine/threonine protein kinase/Tol biopolymer transport system component